MFCLCLVQLGFMLKERAVSSWCCSDSKDLVKMLKDNVVGMEDWMAWTHLTTEPQRRIAVPVDTHSSSSAFPIPPRRGSRAGELLVENRIMWIRGRWDKFLEHRQERIIAKYIIWRPQLPCSMASSWEGNVLEEAVKGGAVKCSALALAMPFVPYKTGFLRVSRFWLNSYLCRTIHASGVHLEHALTALMTLLLEETTVIEKYFMQNYFIRHRWLWNTARYQHQTPQCLEVKFRCHFNLFINLLGNLLTCWH